MKYDSSKIVKDCTTEDCLKWMIEERKRLKKLKWHKKELLGLKWEQTESHGIDDKENDVYFLEQVYEASIENLSMEIKCKFTKDHAEYRLEAVSYLYQHIVEMVCADTSLRFKAGRLAEPSAEHIAEINKQLPRMCGELIKYWDVLIKENKSIIKDRL